jgi:hypothetical protein
MNQAQLERVRLLSTRFHALQGLRWALMGAVLAAVQGGYLLIAREPTNDGALICAFGVSMALMVPGQLWLNRYYATHFGRQVMTVPERWWPDRRWLFGAFIYGVIVYFVNSRFPEFPAGGPTLAWVMLIAGWVGLRDWRTRAYYFGLPVTMTTAFLATASGGGALAPNWTLTTLFLVLGATLVPIGLLDHLLLVKLMKEVRQPAEAVAD